ncbi:hypothetical protein [Ligilactobacillus ceti]|uniref:Uncharacterized protein n=1 Tax=Ligilactobacillus ceti DSM 22408 TaxID=1122146 RepID=A0A0R2KHD4_9LACO|nr:hypothetical protein [Ligilactobacillus ceti]KRN88803.1 hypothetical protein IV53_GL000773 [Ligilactobacillus ceti DSM 22408]
MNKKIRILNLLVKLTAIVLIIDGILILGGIYFSTLSWVVNMIIGLLCLGVGYYYYKKETLLIQLYSQQFTFHAPPKAQIVVEVVVIIMKFILALVCLNGILFRLFIEHMAVFG